MRGINFVDVFDKEWAKLLRVSFISRQRWQWSWPESTRLIPPRTNVLRVTTFEVSIKGFSSLSLTYMLSSSVLKCSCTVQMIALSVRESASQQQNAMVDYFMCWGILPRPWLDEKKGQCKDWTLKKKLYSRKLGAEKHLRTWGSSSCSIVVISRTDFPYISQKSYILGIKARHSWQVWIEAKPAEQPQPFCPLTLDPSGAQATLG